MIIWFIDYEIDWLIKYFMDRKFNYTFWILGTVSSSTPQFSVYVKSLVPPGILRTGVFIWTIFTRLELVVGFRMINT